jgi:phospholipid/cholesterol/gamma-HCH transport system substrate-binding protein
MKSKQTDRFSEAVVGVFMVAVIALLAYFTIVISGVDIVLGKSRTPVKIAFSDVGGLKERDNVMYRGMKVGVIDRIDLGETGVVMTALVNSDVVLREKCRISVASLSLLGGNYLLMEEGEGAAQPLADTLFRGEPPADWMRDLGQIARKVNEIADVAEFKSIISNAEASVVKLNAVMTRIEKGEGSVGKLLSSDDTVYNDLKDTVAAARETMASANDTFASAKAVAARLEKGEGSLGKLLSADETVYEDLKSSLANVREVTARLKDGNGLLRKLTDDEKLASDAASLIERLNAASADLAAAASRLAKGEGTLGKLSADSKLYDEVTALLKDVRQIIDNYRDTTPISTFGSLIGGAL